MINGYFGKEFKAYMDQQLALEQAPAALKKNSELPTGILKEGMEIDAIKARLESSVKAMDSNLRMGGEAMEDHRGQDTCPMKMLGQ